MVEIRVYSGIFAFTIVSGKLIYQRTNIKITDPKLLLLPVIIFIAASCNPTKYIPQGDMLLNSNELVLEKGKEQLPSTLSKKAMKPYIRQQPNKRIFGSRFHLGLYNLSNIDKEKWPHGWLRKIGEEPVIFDPSAAERSSGQIKSYLRSKGFFNAEVRDTVRTEKDEAMVTYLVDPGRPYTIADIKYEIRDSVLYRLVMMDTVNCIIERGMIYDVDLLQSERQRLERFIRDIGYYDFSANDIFFQVDSSMMNHQVIIHYVVSQKETIDRYGRQVYSSHKMYRIRDIYMFPDYDPRLAFEKGDAYMMTFDTTFRKGMYFISPPDKVVIKPVTLCQAVSVAPGQLFSLTHVEQTESHLTDLKNYRLVNVSFSDAGTTRVFNGDEGLLDCFIQLTPMQRQSFTVELEGTNTGGNLGGALNLIYQNKSLFKGAEVFNLKLKGAYETLTEDVTGFKNTQQYGIEATLRIPKLMIPYPAKENFVRRHDPKSVVQAGYNYQKLPVYARSVANISLGYMWNGSKYTKYGFYPLSFNLVKLHYVDPDFQEQIDTMSYYANSFRDQRIIGGRYDFTFNNQMIQKSKDFWNVRIGFELAGNLLDLMYKIGDIPKDADGTYELFKYPFAQFVKAEVDATYNYRFNDVSNIVYRFFAGVGWPYGNSTVMPFEEQYYGGGANDIRAWVVRTLGPGSSIVPTTSLINQTADMKLEGNVEYRFKLFWILEGAVFADVGNIWTIRVDEDRPGSQFKFNSFIDDIAVGSGAGLRFDLKFVMLRLDLGVKLRDPQETDGTKWIPLNGSFNYKDDATMVIGMGYPF